MSDNTVADQSGSDRYEERFYDHGAEGRIIFKDSRLRLSSSGPDTEHYPLPIPSTGQQTYVYAGERMAATVGAQRLAGGTKFDFAYTPMSEAAGSGASRYVVQSGNSLIDRRLVVSVSVIGGGRRYRPDSRGMPRRRSASKMTFDRLSRSGRNCSRMSWRAARRPSRIF